MQLCEIQAAMFQTDYTYLLIAGQGLHFSHSLFTLTLFLLNTTCPVLANSVDPDQLASEEAN